MKYITSFIAILLFAIGTTASAAVKPAKQAKAKTQQCCSKNCGPECGCGGDCCTKNK